MKKKLNQNEILIKYGACRKNNRIIFQQYAYQLYVKEYDKNWESMTNSERSLIKNEMIEKYNLLMNL